MNTKVTANRFAETAGQVVGNLKGSKKNFQLSDVLNILVSVIGTYKVLCPLLYSASHKSDGYQPFLSFKISSIRVFLLSVIVAQIQKFVQQCKGILPFCITTIRRREWDLWDFLWNTKTSTRIFVHLIYLNCHPTGFSGEMVNNSVLSKTPCFSVLPGWGGEFQPVLRLSSEMRVSAISLNLELFKVNSSLSSENGWEEKVYKA